jgi:hypothetical protein
MRVTTAVLLLLHGVIHVLGFLKPWQLADVPQLSGRAIAPLSTEAFRAVGALWLITALALVITALLRFIDNESWWMLGAPALVLSQALIVLQWGDAWAGTVANLLLALAVAVGAATQSFHEANRQHAQALLAKAPAGEPPIVKLEDIVDLPPPVRRWLTASGAVGRPRAQTVRLLQRGGLRTASDQRYMPAEAKQYFVVDEPGFVWTVDVTMLRIIPVVGRDTYVDGLGRMLIKAGGLATVADGAGPNFDQGAALRFLGEIVWFPSGALASYITWAPIDDRHAKATLSFKGVVASAVFEFDQRGRCAGMAARRYYEGRSLEPWVIPITEWNTIRGIEMPVRGGAVWKLSSGDFDYYQWEILDVVTNQRTLWRRDQHGQLTPSH